MHVTVWVTSECNLRCSYCYERQDGIAKKNIHIIDEDEIIAYIIANLTQENVVIFHGGEPLLNFRFIEKATLAILEKDSQCKFGFTTNGTIWNEDIEIFLKENKERFEDWISISIDGEAETHDFHRRDKQGRGTYEKVLQVSQKMLDIFPNLRARMTVTSKSCASLAKNIKFIMNLGFKIIVPIIDLYDKEWTDLELEYLSDEVDKIIEQYEYREEMVIGILEECKYLRKKEYCTFCTNIYVDGNIYPCAYVTGNEQFVIGSIWKGIDDEKKDELFNIVRQNNVECDGCVNLNYCTYNRCKFLNYSVEGDFYMPCEVGCAYENLKYKKMKHYLNKQKGGERDERSE